MRRFLVTGLLAGALALAGCDNDDDGGGGGTDTPPATDAATGDLFAIAGRAADDAPARLDRAALAAQAGDLLGDGDSAGPIDVEEGDDALTALQRRRDAAL